MPVSLCRCKFSGEMRITMRKIWTGIIASLLTAGCLFASGFATLKMGSDARSAGMGMAATAMGAGGAAPFWNPASAGIIQGQDVVLSLHRWMDDIQSEFLGYAAGNGKHGAGLYVLFTEVGNLEYRTVPSNEPLGYFSAHEMVVGATYARKITPNLTLGLAVKGYYEKIFTDDTWGLGGDLGFLYETSIYDIRVGGVVQNIGQTGRLEHDSVPLPLTGKLGVIKPFSMTGGEWLATMDLVREKDFPTHIHAGAEYCWHALIALRAGFQSGYDTRDITGGIGIIHHQFRFDYNYMPMSVLGDSHRLSLGISW